MNSTCNTFELFDFRKADWSGLCASIKSVNWKALLYDCIPYKFISVIIEVIYALYMFPLSVTKRTLYQSFTEQGNFDEEEIKTFKKYTFYLLQFSQD